jgi:hypothetical protein
MDRSHTVRSGGPYGSDDADISSEKTRGKRVRRKPKVSWGRLIRPGSVDPKPRPKGVGDGQSVNIRILHVWRYQLTSAQKARRSPPLDVWV